MGRLVKEQRVCATYAEAATVALRAGNDIIMTTSEFDSVASRSAIGLATDQKINRKTVDGQ